VRTQETFDYWDWDEVGDNNDNPDNVDYDYENRDETYEPKTAHLIVWAVRGA